MSSGWLRLTPTRGGLMTVSDHVPRSASTQRATISAREQLSMLMHHSLLLLGIPTTPHSKF